MSDNFRDNWKYVSGALLLHALLGVLLIVVAMGSRHTVMPQAAIKGVMIDRAALNRMLRPTPAEPLAPPAPIPAPPPEPPPPKVDKSQELEQQALQKRNAEQKKQLELQRQVDLEKQQQLAAQVQVQAEAKRQQEEADKKRLADIKQKQLDVDKKRQAELDAKEHAAREAELQAQIAAEEGRAQAVSAGLLNQYVALLNQRVERNWTKPPSAKQGLDCQVKVTQASGGTVLSVTIGSCNGDEAVKQSIEVAVYRSSPVPAPPDARLFDRNLTFHFKPVE